MTRAFLPVMIIYTTLVLSKKLDTDRDKEVVSCARLYIKELISTELQKHLAV